ncbi:phosphoenolpyruvate--protein phosphotransferase [Sporolituus thermophilus]|uniref:Phosphoenolpyruvate-protein phosphotransferase n=1 Tax=Sporolituus thermophilus DSM 23256 TaxID=1123285 RepID=A0A1G7L9B0_9FIRM|nr:phosphoenolpyruvate--protein phosphotransferase [Sporolituus thermophilus]SDF45966.1 phosphotransferase system, enzyme I, PtsI [Sporolituus thermophilus DSM 23256]
MCAMFVGRPVSPGISAPARLKSAPANFEQYLRQYQSEPPEGEKCRLEQALSEAAAELRAMANAARGAGKADLAAVLDVQLEILSDPVVKDEIIAKIRAQLPAPQAVLDTYEHYAAEFAAMDDEYFRARAADIRDAGRRVARRLLNAPAVALEDSAVVLFGGEIEPSLLAEADNGQLAGLILGQAGITSHAAIIAKSRSIPAVAVAKEVFPELADGLEVIVDGNAGAIIINPDKQERDHYQRLASDYARRQREVQAAAMLPATTVDGAKITVAANIARPQDMTVALKAGCEGVGLFRTEFVFAGRATPPTEEEQFKQYSQTVKQCGEHLCVIRTLDVGGDKPLPYINHEREQNPFLGWRGIRISLSLPELFLAQLKAILRAGCYGKVAVMLPMVACIDELHQAKQFMAEAKRQLAEQGQPFAKDVPLGIMVETPASALMADVWAQECDFFSIGTNDLIQYTLAADRGNPRVSSLYSCYHPAVLRLIKAAADAARKQGIWVSVCGEMAADPLAAALLVGFGVDKLSVNPASAPEIKAAIRRLSVAQAKEVANEVLAMTSADEVKQHAAAKIFPAALA